MGIWGIAGMAVVVNPWLARRLRAEARHREETPRRFVLSAIEERLNRPDAGLQLILPADLTKRVRAASQTPDLPYVINAVEAALHRDER